MPFVRCGWEAQFRVAYDPGAIDTRPGHTLMENEEVEAPRHGATNTAPGLNPHLESAGGDRGKA